MLDFKNMKINTDLKEIVKEIQIKGFPEGIEEKNRISDVFGNAKISDIIQLFTDFGESKILWILSKIWDIKQVINFYNQHIGKYFRKIVDQQKEINSLKDKIPQLEQKAKNHENDYIECQKLEDELVLVKQEVVKLKVKLYDIISQQ
jgi:hypothetical protein